MTAQGLRIPDGTDKGPSGSPSTLPASIARQPVPALRIPPHVPLPPCEGTGLPTEPTEVARPGVARPRALVFPKRTPSNAARGAQMGAEPALTPSGNIITAPFPEARALGSGGSTDSMSRCPVSLARWAGCGAVPRTWMPGYRGSSSVGICGRGSDLASASPWGGLGAAGVPDVRTQRAGSAS